MAKDRRFFDCVRIHAKSGNGGHGLAGFRKEKYVPFGGPDGGDGGKGGDVILKVSSDVSHLEKLFYKSIVSAENGQHGGKARKTGKNGRNKIIQIPCGTVVHQIQRKDLEDLSFSLKKQENEKSSVIADLVEEGEKFVLSRGGVGGKGNWRFKSSTNQAPQEHTLGEKGEEGIFLLELRQIADVGLVGFPNAGKSTLLSKVSEAKPKVASYPFTTLNPVIGILNFQDYKRCSIADIPGLIEGAYQNKGLGHQFLRHILRCRILLFVVDAGSEEQDPIESLEILRKEISHYQAQLSEYPWFIVASKMDLPKATKTLEHLTKRFPRQKIFPISAKEGKGLEELKSFLEEYFI